MSSAERKAALAVALLLCLVFGGFHVATVIEREHGSTPEKSRPALACRADNG